jgi:hypothetical protein
MHLTLKRGNARPPVMNSRQPQVRFDAFIEEFDTERPHEALEMGRPAERSVTYFSGLDKCLTPTPGRPGALPRHVEHGFQEIEMPALRWIVLGVGILLVLMGVVWIGQGTDIFPYPKESFMINQRPWVLRGAMLAVAGLVVVLLSRIVGRK